MRKRIYSMLLCVLLLVGAVTPVFAAETGSITVWFRHEGQPVADASFALYKAAEWNDSGYALVDPFSSYPVRTPDDPSSDEWKALASTLAAYADRDQVVPLTTGKTDATGKLTFAGLETGLYLVIGEIAQSGDRLLFPQPMLVTVPFRKTDGTDDPNVVIEPKYDSQVVVDKTVMRRALKIWKDDGNEQARPQEITVQLLCDGEPWDEQVLSAENNWSYTWENLEAAHVWRLTEKQVPADYTVEITQEGVTFTVTNTNDAPPPPSSDVPPPPSSVPPPQTGLLWWPVPILFALGAIAVGGGILLLLRKKS